MKKTTPQEPLAEGRQAEQYKELRVACRNATNLGQLRNEIIALQQQGLDLYHIEYEQPNNRSCLFSLLNNDHLNPDDFKQIFLLLVEHGANPQSRNTCKRKLLQQAAALDKVEIVKWLVEHQNVDVNEQDDNGDTALHQAVYWKCLNTVDYLVKERKASCTVFNNNKQLAGDIKDTLPEIKALLLPQETFNKQSLYPPKMLLKQPSLLFKHPKPCLQSLVHSLPGFPKRYGLQL